MIYLLQEARRRPNALPLFGFRDVILCGDTCQLTPTDDAVPFWASSTFQNYFEIFRLREDRRHERDPHLQDVKELLAWGGVHVDDTLDPFAGVAD